MKRGSHNQLMDTEGGLKQYHQTIIKLSWHLQTKQLAFEDLYKNSFTHTHTHTHTDNLIKEREVSDQLV